MAAQKPSIPKGTRDFSPTEMVRRNYLFDTIRSVYKKYGYLPIETPAMENIETLMGKYGEEGDRLIFRILESGNFLEKVPIAKPAEIDNMNQLMSDIDALNSQDIPADKLYNTINATLNKWVELMPYYAKWSKVGLDSQHFAQYISQKALRYDLTVPFARYVVMHQHEISFPFKRYQIQPVWRADRPQRGRYREFYQCDADVIGSNSLLNEVELVQIIDEVFTSLRLPALIKLNNRKILSGIAEAIGEKEKIVDITVAIDKLDKIGAEGVNKELREKGISENAIEKLQPIINFSGTYHQKIEVLEYVLGSSEIGRKGIAEIETIFSHVAALGLSSAQLELDITLARGLNYYTGAIFEVKAAEGSLRVSICGGGRYDDLTGIFGLPGLSGVGISFGADRICDVLEELNLYPEEVSASTKLLFAVFSAEDQAYCLKLLQQVRKAGISAELYPDAVKMQKQMKYADGKGIPFVAIVGENERREGLLMLKNMKTGEQEKVTLQQLLEKLA